MDATQPIGNPPMVSNWLKGGCSLGPLYADVSLMKTVPFGYDPSGLDGFPLRVGCHRARHRRTVAVGIINKAVESHMDENIKTQKLVKSFSK